MGLAPNAVPAKRAKERIQRTRIVLVSPASLMATLRTIDYIWKQDDQRRNLEEIIKQASLILDSIRLIGEAFSAADKHLDEAQNGMKDARKRLEMLSKRSEKLRELGVPEKSNAKKAKKLGTADAPPAPEETNGDTDPEPGEGQ